MRASESTRWTRLEQALALVLLTVRAFTLAFAVP